MGLGLEFCPREEPTNRLKEEAAEWGDGTLGAAGSRSYRVSLVGLQFLGGGQRKLTELRWVECLCHKNFSPA